jgi:hypothetical protein
VVSRRQLPQVVGRPDADCEWELHEEYGHEKQLWLPSPDTRRGPLGPNALHPGGSEVEPGRPYA